MFSSNSHQPKAATSGNCMKLMGVSAETSPRLRARVHSMWPPVPRMPVAMTHSHVMPCGHCHTLSAGKKVSGTHSSAV